MKLTFGSSRRAKAASSRAARSRSSRATISFGLCMYRLGTDTSPVGMPHDTGTDADAIYNALRGIPTGLVSVPNRYMHSPNDMVARDDLERASRLLAASARRLDPKISFIPA